MQAAGIEIDKYVAYEVDKYAIQTARHNFPFIDERVNKYVIDNDGNEQLVFDF